MSGDWDPDGAADMQEEQRPTALAPPGRRAGDGFGRRAALAWLLVAVVALGVGGYLLTNRGSGQESRSGALSTAVPSDAGQSEAAATGTADGGTGGEGSAPGVPTSDAGTGGSASGADTGGSTGNAGTGGSTGNAGTGGSTSDAGGVISTDSVAPLPADFGKLPPSGSLLPDELDLSASAAAFALPEDKIAAAWLDRRRGLMLVTDRGIRVTSDLAFDPALVLPRNAIAATGGRVVVYAGKVVHLVGLVHDTAIRVTLPSSAKVTALTWDGETPIVTTKAGSYRVVQTGEREAVAEKAPAPEPDRYALAAMDPTHPAALTSREANGQTKRTPIPFPITEVRSPATASGAGWVVAQVGVDAALPPAADWVNSLGAVRPGRAVLAVTADMSRTRLLFNRLVDTDAANRCAGCLTPIGWDSNHALLLRASADEGTDWILSWDLALGQLRRVSELKHGTGTPFTVRSDPG